MTTRYPLRSRATAAVPTAVASGPEGKSSEVTGLGTNTAVPGTGVIYPPSSPSARSYRDVVASRPPSAAAQRDESLTNIEQAPVRGVSPQGADLLPVRGVGPQVAAASPPVRGVRPQVAFVSNESSKEDSKLTSFSSIPDDEGGPWTLVAPRRVRSVESLRGRGSASRARVGEVASPNRNVLTWEQEKAIALARGTLTSEERERINERNVRLNIPDVQMEDTFVQGSSKGKGPDPRDWGAAGLEPSEMEIEAQRLAFESYAKAHALKILEEPPVAPVQHLEDAPKASRNLYRASVEEVEDVEAPPKPQMTKAPVVALKSVADSEGARASSMAETAKVRVANAVAGRSNSVSVKSAVTNEMRAVSQIAPGSYLANALANVRHGSISDDEGPPSSSDSSSSLTSSSSESSDSGSERSESSPERSRKRRRGSSKKKKHAPKRMKGSKSTLKPIPPKEYDGSPDSRAYHRFVTEGSDYVRTGNVAKKRRVFVLSYYLKGKAYDYYTQKVSLNVYSWTLEQFFEGLFDYCFPVNYRMKQREKLRRAFQNDKSVTDYCHELEELFNSIGDVSERDRVIKLWNGLRGSIQQGLWRDRLNPDVSGFDMVKAAAEVIEISENVAGWRGGRVEARRPKRSRWLGGGGSSGGQQRGGSNTPSTSQPSAPATSASGRNGRMNGFNSNRQGNSSGHPNQSRPPARNDGRRSGGREASSLSKTERDELLAQGKCFRCKESGHLSRNCPRGNTVKGSRGGGAPGLSSNNVEFDFEEIDRLRDLAETTETLGDALTVNFMHFQAEGPMKYDLDPTVKRRPCNGDFAAQRAVQLLTLKAPYPNDGPPKLHPDEPRFEVAEADGGLHVITDYEHPLTDSELISTHLLFEPGFNLPKWYADKRAFHNGRVLDPGSRWENSPPMGPVLALGLVAALQEGMNEYPEDLDGIRDTEWSVATYDDGARFWIRGHDTRRVVLIERARLLDNQFDFISWYRDQLTYWGDGPQLEPGMEPCWDGCEDCALEGKFPARRGSHCVGDWRAFAAARMLEDDGPYPGDPPEEYRGSGRFSLTSCGPDSYNLRDNLINEDRRVPTAVVTNPNSPFSLWYAKHRLHQSGGGTSALNLHPRFGEHTLGEYFAVWICKELEGGAPYSSDHLYDKVPYDHDSRFALMSSIDGGVMMNCIGTLVWIIDHRRCKTTTLDITLMDDPLFDLRRWYAGIIYEMDAIDHGVEVPDPEDGRLGGPAARNSDNVLHNRTPADSEGSVSAMEVDDISDDPRIDGDLELPDLVSVTDSDAGEDDLPELESVADSDIGEDGLTPEPSDGTPSVYGPRRIQIHAPDGPSAHELRSTAVHAFSVESPGGTSRVTGWLDSLTADDEATEVSSNDGLEAFGVQIPRGTYSGLQKTTAVPKDFTRIVPKPLVVVVKVNGHPARALLDSGSLGDFMSTSLADQLKVKRVELEKPLSLQLAVQGSRSKVNCGTNVSFEYQDVKEERYFDIANISNYDLILGTPWLFQHGVSLGLNPARVVVGSAVAQPVRGNGVAKISARAVDVLETELERVRQELVDYARPLCKKPEETELPPLRAINHTIPLIDETKIYPWRPSKCPGAFREQWRQKQNAYIKTRRWEITSAKNTVPMLLIPKPPKKGKPAELRTVIDLRARNANTIKMASPLPDQQGIFSRVAQSKYMSLMDQAAAYEQVRIEPGHVSRTAVTTPDGNMVSNVIQIGDCNGPATFQALMNHIFSPYLGVFMDAYLDDIVVYSGTLEDHVRHVKLVLDILKREKFYLNPDKLFFLAPELKLLGHIISRDGVKMDPAKVDTVVNWKVPTNRDLLRAFLGAVGYLADNVADVRVPMGVLHTLTGDTVPFRWEYTHQRAFADIKGIIDGGRDHWRVPLKYSNDADPVYLITDGSSTGISGIVAQGPDWKTAKVAAFFSAKLNPAQQNYPVHEIEMLAGVESMLRHREVLQGVRFQWITDHKGLTHLLNQKNLSGRQARWMEKIGEFDFEVVYVPGVDNVLADALSRMYSNEMPGTVRSPSEYTYHDVVNEDPTFSHDITMPLLAGIEAMAATISPRRRKEAPLADTGRPETSKEFAARMKGHVHFKAPRRVVEGVTHPVAGIADDIADEAAREAVVIDGVLEGLGDVTRPQTDLVDCMHDDGIDLLREIRDKYEGDPFFKGILASPKSYRNFAVEDGLVYLQVNDGHLLCIPKVHVKGRNVREIVISEAHSLLAHLGAAKTLAYLKDNVWWKDMVSDTVSYCNTCITCKRSKPSNQKPHGLLNPLEVPGKPWESMGIDFVGPLPESSNRDGSFDSITVVICLMSGMVHLIPSRATYSARQMAELVFEHVYKLHGLPKSIVSDRDVLFTSTFWQRLHQLIGTKLRMSSAYHPETDGSTERANRTVTQMLRQCIGPKQKDWVEKLPAIEFAINSARSESTGYAPFFLNTGSMPRSMIWNSGQQSEFPGVRNFALKRKLALMAAHDSILAARVKQVRTANRRRRMAPFTLDDLVYISTKNLKFEKGLARKLIPKYVGPYKIIQDFGNQSFRVDLPAHLKQRGVHDVFHASLLRVHSPNDDRLFPGRLDSQLGNDIVGAEPEWAVDRIIGHSGKGTEAIFKLQWKSGDVTWLPYDRVVHLDALSAYLDLLSVTRIAKLPHGDSNLPDNIGFHAACLNFAASAGREFAGIFGRAGVVRDIKGRGLRSRRSARSRPTTQFSSSGLPWAYSPHPSRYTHSRPTHSTVNCLTPDNCLTLSTAMSSTPTNRYLERMSQSSFFLRASGNHEGSLSVHAGQLRQYIGYDHRVRKHRAMQSNIPAGYLEFARQYNATSFEEKFACVEGGELKFANSKAPSVEGFHVKDIDIFTIKDMKLALEVAGFTVLNESDGRFYHDLVREEAARSVRNSKWITERKELKRKEEEDRVLHGDDGLFSEEDNAPKPRANGGRYKPYTSTSTSRVKSRTKPRVACSLPVSAISVAEGSSAPTTSATTIATTTAITPAPQAALATPTPEGPPIAVLAMEVDDEDAPGDEEADEFQSAVGDDGLIDFEDFTEKTTNE